MRGTERAQRQGDALAEHLQYAITARTVALGLVRGLCPGSNVGSAGGLKWGVGHRGHNCISKDGWDT